MSTIQKDRLSIQLSHEEVEVVQAALLEAVKKNTPSNGHTDFTFVYAKNILKKLEQTTPKHSLEDLFIKILKHREDKRYPNKPYAIWLYAEGLDETGFKRITASWPIGSLIRYDLDTAKKEAKQIGEETGIEVVPYKESE